MTIENADTNEVSLPLELKHFKNAPMPRNNDIMANASNPSVPCELSMGTPRRSAPMHTGTARNPIEKTEKKKAANTLMAPVYSPTRDLGLSNTGISKAKCDRLLPCFP